MLKPFRFFSALLSLLFYQASGQSLPAIYLELEDRYNRNDFEACSRMEKRVEAFASARMDTLASNSYFYLGDAFNQLGDQEKAIRLFEHENEILARIGMRGTTDFSNSLNNLAYLYLQSGQYAKAGAAADALLENDRKLFEPTAPQFVESVIYAADIYLQLDQLKRSEQLLVSTLRAQSGPSSNRGLLLSKLGDLYSYTGQYSKASDRLMKALDVHAEEEGEESAGYINAAINLGILYMNQGKYPEAEEIFDVALSKVDRSENAYFSILNNQALVLQSLGQYDRAERMLQEIKAADSAALGTSHPDFAVTLSNLGLVYADLGRFSKAQTALTRALEIQSANGENKSTSYARKLNNLAKAHQLAGSPEKALPLLEQSLTLFRKNLGKESPEYATSAYNLGVALWKAGKGKAGYRYLKVSAAIRETLLGKDHPQYAESILKVAEYEWENKRIREARQSFRQVFDNYYFQIGQTFPGLTEEEKSRFYQARIRETLDKFNSLATGFHKTEPMLVADTYNYLINTKAAIMLATEKVRSSILASGDTTLIGQFESWQSAREQIARLYSMNQEHAHLDSLLRAADALEKQLARKSAAFEGQLVRRTYDLKEIQSALMPGEAAVEVLRYRTYTPHGGGKFEGDAGYVFLVLTGMSDQPEMIAMTGGTDLETKYLRYYRNNIRYDLEDMASYEQFIGPLSRFLRGKNIRRVYFSPDGVYNQININTLKNPETGKFILEEFDVRFVTNTRELVETQPHASNGGHPALIGYPKFNLDEREIQRTTRSATLNRGANRTWRGGLLRYMNGEEGIAILPGTEQEIEKISALFGEEVQVFTEREATERIVRQVSNPKVLHIATHGYFLEDDNESSARSYFSNPLLNAGLILAGAENFLRTGEPVSEEGDDGILTAFEAMNLNLDETQLVVLSACETALGSVQNGEGVYGLQRAFKLAGTQSMVMSLWNVDDDATQHLMTTFYEEMLRTGDAHKAFRTAQLNVKAEHPSPHYWGAFVMVGI